LLWLAVGTVTVKLKGMVNNFKLVLTTNFLFLLVEFIWGVDFLNALAVYAD
jgi:hypothetical protein